MKNLKVYFTSDLHGYMYPTDYIDRSQKNIGLLNIINQFITSAKKGSFVTFFKQINPFCRLKKEC